MSTIIERSLRSLSTLRGFAPRFSIGRAAPSLIGLLKGADPGKGEATDRDRWSISTSPITRRESLVALGATLLAACFSDRPDPTGNGNGNGSGLEVEMTPQLTFEPATVTIEAGQAVTWRNTSSFFHTATGDGSKANDPSLVALPEGASPWDSDVVNAGEEFTRTFDVPGEYRYFCIPHEAQDMVGSIVVLSS